MDMLLFPGRIFFPLINELSIDRQGSIDYPFIDIHSIFPII